MQLTRLSALLFCSGAAALILEVAWFRRMAQLAGATSVALASVLAAVIGGMALGAFVLGRRVEHSPNPLRFYGACELAVAVLAFASPHLLEWTAPWFVGAGMVTRFLLASLLLMPAALFMGGTLPAMAAALQTREDELGRGLGWLYAWNTFGAVTGTLLAGFVLLETFGLTATIRIAAVLSGVAGGVALCLKPAAQTGAPTDPETPFSQTDRRRAAALFALSGFLGMACEGAFVRGLVLVFGSTTYAFTTMLAVFLFGIAGGGAIGTRFAHRARVLQRLETTIGVTAALFALGAVGVYFLPLLYLHLYAWLGGGFATGITIRFALAALVLLPGAVGGNLHALLDDPRAAFAVCGDEVQHVGQGDFAQAKGDGAFGSSLKRNRHA
jgi:spermidine synthase